MEKRYDILGGPEKSAVFAAFEHALDHRIERGRAVVREDHVLGIVNRKKTREILAAAIDGLRRPQGHAVSAAPRIGSVSAHRRHHRVNHRLRLGIGRRAVIKIYHRSSTVDAPTKEMLC